MEAAPSVALASPPVAPDLWRLTRVSLPYLLDSIAISRDGADVIDTLLLAAIGEGNLARMSRDASLQMTYAATPPPDDMRRPVSINAIAESLALPFETARRRIARLADKGACVIVPGGVIVPQAQRETPEFTAMCRARYERLKRFYFDLAAEKALPPLADAAREPAALPPGVEPFLVDNRVLTDYLLRFIDNARRLVGDPLTGLMLLEMARSNTEHLTPAQMDAIVPVPERRRRPVSTVHLAKRVGLPTETARRRIAVLESEGFCRRTPQGVAVLSTGLQRPGLRELILGNAVEVERLFNRLHQLGVIARWTRAPAAA